MDVDSSGIMKNNRKEILIFSLCLLAGFLLRFYTFDQKSLWMDEIYTFDASRDNIEGQLKFYKENPSNLHPPLFFILTHLLYPFPKPERDLRIIPLIFGTLSIPLIYLLSRTFAASIALPCTLCLTFMTYHISLSQEGRSYSLLMFLAMAALYFFMRHLQTSKKRYLVLVAVSFAILFHTSYSSIPFLALSQILWFYRPSVGNKKPSLSSFFFLNGLTLLLCLPWLIFVAVHYKGQTVMQPLHNEIPGSFGYVLSGVLHDWAPHAPLMIVSVLLLIFFPILSKCWGNALVLLAVLVFPIGGLYLFCKSLNITHFVTSRYFISFLPMFLITLFLSLDALEVKFRKLRSFMSLKLLLVVLFSASNLIILPLYYRSEKQDLRGIATYLKGQLKNGDKIVVGNVTFIPAMLHYFGAHPTNRYHTIPAWKVSENEIEYRIGLDYRNIKFTFLYSEAHWFQYFRDGERLWIVADKINGKILKEKFPCTLLKGYFDGSFLNLTRFPSDASLYLFLWDPNSPNEKGIDIPIE